MDEHRKKATWFLQIDGWTKNEYGRVTPRTVDWTAKFSYPLNLGDVGREIRKKAAAEKLTEWSLVHLQCLGRQAVAPLAFFI